MSKNPFITFLISKKTKRILLGVWLLLIVLGLFYYILHHDRFTPEKIKVFLSHYENTLMVLYVVICLVRGLFLIPSTPFVFAGVLLFPEQLWWVFIISVIGVCFSASFIYFFGQFLELDKLILKKEKRVQYIKNKVNDHGFWIVLIWSFFPIVPTDLICYVASITKMNYLKFISALFIGESILIALYVWFGDYLANLF